MSADLERKMFCWPLEWINAAVKSGLADRREHGCVMRRIEGDAMRDALTEFTLLVVGHAVAEEEREAADALAAQRERIAALERAIRSEPELPGEMPDEMWECIRDDRDAVTEAMRIAVRQTKEGILARAAIAPAAGAKRER